MAAFSLSGKIGLDARDFVKGAGQAADALEDVQDKVDDLSDEEIRLDADAKPALSEIGLVDKELAGLGNEEVKIDADAKPAIDEVDKIADAADDVGKKAGSNLSDGMSAELDGVGDGLGSDLGVGIIGGLAGAGIGAGLLEAMDLAVTLEQVQADFQGRFGLMADDADRLGQVAGGLYADAWGDSMEEVYDAVGVVNQRLVETGQIAEDEVGKIAELALAVGQTWDTDVDAVIRSASQLMLNDLAPSAETAMDIIVTGFQNGADVAGDWLDTIDEYSQHFAAMGLSGEDALVLIQTGLQNGQRDADKLADAIKEMGIRSKEDTDAVADAYNRLGLNMGAVQDAISEGGDTARDAFMTVIDAIDEVEDPTEQYRIGVELIGTQYEDLGPTAIDILQSIGTETVETTGKAEELAKTVGETTAASFESSKREGQDFITTIGRGLVEIGLLGKDAAEGFGLMGDDIGNLNQFAREFKGTSEELEQALKDAGASGIEIIQLMRVYGDRLDDTTDATGELTTESNRLVDAEIMAALEAKRLHDRTLELRDAHVTTGERAEIVAQINEALAEKQGAAADAADDHREALSQLRDKLDAAVDGVIALNDAQRESEDANLAAVHAQRSLDDAVTKLTEDQKENAAAYKDGTRTMEQWTEAELDAYDQALDTASAITAQEIATREAAGETVTASAKQDIYRNALGQVATKLDGPVKSAIERHKATIASVPSNKITEIQATLDVSRAEATYQYWRALPRSLKIDAYIEPTVINERRRAMGGPVEAGTAYTVGERGPELFIPQSDGHIVPNHQLNGLSAAVPLAGPVRPSTVLASPSPGATVNVTNMTRPTTVAELSRALRVAQMEGVT